MLKQIYFVALAAALISSGCSSDGNERRQEYLDADYYTRLELPPDLTSSSDKNQLSAPRPTDDATAKFKQDTADLGSGEIQNTVLIVEHPPVITLGARQSANKLLATRGDLAQKHIDVVDIRRGGGTTAHNPFIVTLIFRVVKSDCDSFLLTLF